MWKVILVVGTKESADKTRRLLSDFNINVKIIPVNKSDSSSPFEILVPETEVNKAHQILVENNL